MLKGWILYKHNPKNSHESNRLVEEFQKDNIEVNIINPNDIDIDGWIVNNIMYLQSCNPIEKLKCNIIFIRLKQVYIHRI